MDADLSEKIGNYITELLYDRRFVYQHAWQTGDYLIADNYEVCLLSIR
jgi:alpha-ketoglutarate-dependent taurine dioxygenase